MNTALSTDTPHKNIITTKLFGAPCRIAKLAFIGAGEYFITDFGAVWSRKAVFPDKRGIVTKYYRPTVIRDMFFPYPWVLLGTTAGLIWFPVHHLLGWAFVPTENPAERYYIPKQPFLLPMKVDFFHWQVSPPFQTDRSRYLEFVKQWHHLFTK